MRNVFGGVLGARYVWPKNIMFHCYCLSIWWPYALTNVRFIGDLLIGAAATRTRHGSRVPVPLLWAN